MAIIKDPLTSRWRDKSGGFVGYKQGDQAGVRAHCVPVQRWPAVKQKWARGSGEIMRLWRGLSGSQRDGWGDFGEANPETDRYGETVYLSGFNWFERYNSRLLLSKGKVIEDAPAGTGSTYDPGWSCWVDYGTEALLLGFDSAPVGDEWAIVEFRARCPVSLGKAPRPLEHRGFIEFPSVSPWVVGYLPGVGAAPERHWIRAQAGDGFGRVSDEWYGDVVT